MGGQNFDRRQALLAMTTAVAASHFTGFRTWSSAWAQEPHQHPSGSATMEPYEPVFFDQEEYALVQRLAELIIPSDDTPGAKEAGVAEFVDFIASQDPELQFPLRFGLGWLNARARLLHGDVYLNVPPEKQIEMLKRFAYAQQFLPEERDGQELFRVLRDQVVLGFYTSKVGLEELDYPGLQMAYSNPGCPHKDDREHERLPTPRA